MSESWRLFVALHLPSEVIATLDAAQHLLRAAVPQGAISWVAPRSIHLTLKFLGEVPLNQRDAITEALTTVACAHAPFDLSTGGLGCFPHQRNPRVVWIGVQGQLKALQLLRDAVEGAIAPLGYPTEDRPFSPHLTLGRVRRDAQRSAVQTLGAAIASVAAPPAVTWTVTEVALFRSELKPTGAVYTLLHRARLSQLPGR